MSKTDIPINLQEDPFPKYQNQFLGKPEPSGPTTQFLDTKSEGNTRRRSNSQSQVIQQPSTRNADSRLKPGQVKIKERPLKRNLAEYYVTLSTLNDTFDEKHLLVPWHPETIKLGRPTASKTKPDVTNGYFDSRVLSRNHAAMFFDPVSEKIMIQDLGSSNGTFVNDKKISDKPVPIEIGDVINLGFHIQVESNHKQISARVKNINVLANFVKPSTKEKLEISDTSFDFQHHDFIQSIFAKLPNDSALPELNVGVNNTKKIVGNHSKVNNRRVKPEPVSFESALFSDINPNLEEALLGLGNRGNTGIFNNSQITNTISLENTISMLTVCLSKVNQQNNTLKSLENFVGNYQVRLEELNSQYLSKEMGKLTDEYKQKIIVHQTSNKKLNKTNEELKAENATIHEKYNHLQSQFEILQQQLQDANASQHQYESEVRMLMQRMEEQNNQHQNGTPVAKGVQVSISPIETPSKPTTSLNSNESNDNNELKLPEEEDFDFTNENGPMRQTEFTQSVNGQAQELVSDSLKETVNGSNKKSVNESPTKPVNGSNKKSVNELSRKSLNGSLNQGSASLKEISATQEPTEGGSEATLNHSSSIDDDLAAILSLQPEIEKDLLAPQHHEGPILKEKKIVYVSLSVVVLGVLYRLYNL